MHLWASIEHSLKYKYYRNIPENLKVRLIEASRIAYDLDVEMSKIKHEMEILDEASLKEETYDLDFDYNDKSSD